LDNEEIANRFVDQIWDKFPLMATQPRMGVERPDIAHEARVVTFHSYLILYRLKEKGIEIVRVVHGAQRMEGLF